MTRWQKDKIVAAERVEVRERQYVKDGRQVRVHGLGPRDAPWRIVEVLVPLGTGSRWEHDLARMRGQGGVGG